MGLLDQEAKGYRAFRLNRALSKWQPVDAPNVQLYSADGDKLVFAEGWHGPIINLRWLPQPQLSSQPAGVGTKTVR